MRKFSFAIFIIKSTSVFNFSGACIITNSFVFAISWNMSLFSAASNIRSWNSFISESSFFTSLETKLELSTLKFSFAISIIKGTLVFSSSAAYISANSSFLTAVNTISLSFCSSSAAIKSAKPSCVTAVNTISLSFFSSSATK